MIAYIEGSVVATTESSCIITTASGVGYEVFLSSSTLAKSKTKGQTVCFYVCSVVREDAFELFGFESWDERETFVVLRTINRVGARTALSILSVFHPDDLRRIVAEENIHALTSVPGIGKKSAQQIFLDLKYKMVEGPVARSSINSKKTSGVQADAIAGLLNLGYGEFDAEQAVGKALAVTPDLTVGEALRSALKILSRGNNG